MALWIGVDQLRQMSTEDIYCLLLPQIEKLYTKYNYIPLSKEYYDDVVIDAIECIVYDAPGKTISIEIFVQKIERYLKEYINLFKLFDVEETTQPHKMVASVSNISEPLLSAEEERNLIIRAKAGDKDAMEELIRKNTGLIEMVAKQIKEESGTTKLDYSDFYQEGVLALYEIIEKFDLKLNFRLSPYALRSIYHRLTRMVQKEDQLVLKCYQERILFIRTYEEVFSTFDQPSLKMVADLSGIPYDKVKYHYNTIYALSLDSFVNEEGRILGDLIEDEDAIPLEKHAMNIELKEKLQKPLSKMTKKQKIILDARYGLADGKRQRPCEIAKEFGVSNQAITDSERRALRKLKEESLRVYL